MTIFSNYLGTLLWEAGLLVSSCSFTLMWGRTSSVDEPIPFENRTCIDFSDAGSKLSVLCLLLTEGHLNASHEATC